MKPSLTSLVFDGSNKYDPNFFTYEKKLIKKKKTPKNNNRPRSKGKVTGFEYFKCNRGFVENGSD